MAQRDNRSDWTVFIAIGLIVLGAWLLMERVLGPLFAPIREVIRFVGALAWPAALIALGVLLLIAARRPGGQPGQFQGRRLYRSRTDRKVSGVLGGVAGFLGIDPTIIRVGYVLLAFISWFFPAIVLYVIAAVVVPEEPLTTPVPPEWPVTGDYGQTGDNR